MELKRELWKQIHKLDPSTVHTIHSMYREPFLVEVRENLSEWIEARFLDSNLDAYNPTHHPIILQLIGDFHAAIQAKAAYLTIQDSNCFTIPIKLSNAANMISTGNPMDPVSLFQHICQCLHTEKEFIRQFYMQKSPCTHSTSQTNQAMGTQSSENGILDMNTNYDELKCQSSLIDHHINQIQNSQDNLIIKGNRLEIVKMTLSQCTPSVVAQPDQVRKLQDENIRLEREIVDEATYIKNKRKALEDLQIKLFESIKIFQTKLLQCLSNWKEEQETESRHVIFIDKIQQWLEGLVEVIAGFTNHVKESVALEQNCNKMPILTRNALASWDSQIQMIVPDYNNEITQLLKELIQHAMIVEYQSDQLLKKGRKITVKVRYLIGRSLQLPLSMQSVQASILNEAGHKKFFDSDRAGALTTCGELENNLVKFKLDGGSSGYVAHFKNLQIKTIKQKTRKGNGDSVLDESYWLIFRAEFNYDGVTHKVFALSVPTKITSHPTQDIRAWETLIWNAACKDQKSECIPWTQLSQILNNRFTMMTKKGLTEDQMKAVEDRAFNVPDVDGGVAPITGVKLITRAQFCKTKIPGTDFTFWNWFYEIAKLTSEHLCGNKFCKSGPWQDNLIIGFISRERAVELLRTNGNHGTFLLRFSDTQCGAITITWVHTVGRDIRSVAPFTTKDLNSRPLSERILDIENLVTLYPNKEKVQSFKTYILPPAKDDNAYQRRYVRSELRAVIDEQVERSITNMPNSFGQGISGLQTSDFGISSFVGVSSRDSSGSLLSLPMNLNDNLTESSDHWINPYYPDMMNETQDMAEDVFSLEDYVLNSAD